MIQMSECGLNSPTMPWKMHRCLVGGAARRSSDDDTARGLYSDAVSSVVYADVDPTAVPAAAINDYAPTSWGRRTPDRWEAPM